MSIEQLSAIIESVVALIMLIVVFLKLLPALRLDIFRQKMFAVRDELFDYAAAGNINFDDPAYRLLRQSMNGNIRYGHQITLFRVCINVLRWKLTEAPPSMAWNEKWNQAIANVKNDDVRSKLLDFHNRSISFVIERLVIGSPLLIAALVIGIVTMLVHSGLRNLKLVCEMAAIRAVSYVVDPNLLQEEAAAHSVA